jgi:thiamine biosynthesis lipoprotein
MRNPLPRRRFIGMSAAAAGMVLLPLAASGSSGNAVAPSPQLRIWRGIALGADAMLQIHHPDPAEADRLIARSVAEVRRLERVFSLYREESALSALNRDGTLDDPPTDLLRLLGESQQVSRLTDGAFDPTVQPLWRLYADHFAQDGADPRGPSEAARAAAVALVDYRKVEIAEGSIRLAAGGMALTLNGIAQGYITDRVAELLLSSGIERALVDMGENRVLGDRPDGTAWRIGIQDPRLPDGIVETIELRSAAISTSGGYGTEFDPAGRFNHIFDPKTGLTSRRYLSVSVIAPQATTADAMSTAFSLLPLDRTASIVRKLGIKAHFILPDGSRLVQTA